MYPKFRSQHNNKVFLCPHPKCGVFGNSVQCTEQQRRSPFFCQASTQWLAVPPVGLAHKVPSILRLSVVDGRDQPWLVSGCGLIRKKNLRLMVCRERIALYIEGKAPQEGWVAEELSGVTIITDCSSYAPTLQKCVSADELRKKRGVSVAYRTASSRLSLCR